MRPLLALLASCAAFAQIGAPRLGLLPDGEHLRPIIGIPAAAMAGRPILAGRRLSTIVISPQQDYAIATDAVNAEVLLIVDGQRATPITGATAAPDRIAISPSGSAAALWFSSTGHAQIVSGLPSTPAVREIDASFLGAARTIAAGDTGWIAGVFDRGVYAFAADTSPIALPADNSVAALSFFAGGSDLLLATNARIFTLRDIAGNPQITSLHEGSLAPVALAVSPDNRNVAVADASGVIYGINSSQGSLAILDCDCTPEGVFPLGNSGFRLTSPASGLVKMYDPADARILVIPVAKAEPAAPRLISHASIPALSISGLPSTSTLGQQLAMTISVASPFTSDITGTATLAFASASSGDDQTIQFGTGGRSVSFTIPAGSTQASFSGKSSVAVLTGTVAGTITITASSADVSTTATVTTPRTTPVISAVTLSQSNGALTAVVTGYTSTREVSSGVFSFTAGGGATLAQTNLTVPLSAAFAQWFGNSASIATGGQFTLTVPFTVQGNASNVVRVAVDLTNQIGVSSVASSQ